MQRVLSKMNLEGTSVWHSRSWALCKIVCARAGTSALEAGHIQTLSLQHIRRLGGGREPNINVRITSPPHLLHFFLVSEG